MTTYIVRGTDGTVIRAGSNDLRIIGIEFYTGTGGLDNGWMYTTTSATISGGTVTTPVAAKAGAPASTATARVGAGATTSGTLSMVGTYYLGSTTTSASRMVWQPLGDLIIASSGTFMIYGGADVTVTWFEELRLSWSY